MYDIKLPPIGTRPVGIGGQKVQSLSKVTSDLPDDRYSYGAHNHQYGPVKSHQGGATNEAAI